MNENANATKWLQYLLYVGIATAINYLLVTVLPSGLHSWIGYALSAASLYLMFRLAGSNGRYMRVVLFAGAALILNILGIQKLALATSLCGIVGQYQEYLAHSELIAERDPKLAGKWSSLFWFQFAVELISGLLITMVATVMSAAGGLESAPIISMATVAIAFIYPILKVLYLVYLKRTIKALETEFVV